MYTKIKYVRVKQFNGIIMFPDWINHSEFKNLNPISAGFCQILENPQKVICYGSSSSLKLDSIPDEDSNFATKQYFNIYE